MTGRLSVGAITIDYDRHRVLRDGDVIHLTPKEFDLLSLLAHHPDCVLPHETILREIWGGHAVDQPANVWVLIRALRKKLEVDPSHPRYLISEPWIGYRLATSEDS